MSCQCIHCGGRLCSGCGQRAVLTPYADKCRECSLIQSSRAKEWRGREDWLIRQVYGRGRIKGMLPEIARMIGRSAAAVNNRARKLGMGAGEIGCPQGRCDMCESGTGYSPRIDACDGRIEILCQGCWEGLQQLRERAA